METVKSTDGTSIGHDRVGEGPVVIFVDGALRTRGGKADLATLLAERFTVYSYDRRIQAPTLVISGTRGLPFMLETAKTLSKTIPEAELRTLDGQAHDVDAEVIAPVLAEFIAAGAW